MDHQDQYNNVCKEKFENAEKTDAVIFKKVEQIHDELRQINKRLFQDNGQKSIMGHISDLKHKDELISIEVEAAKTANSNNPWLKATKYLVITTAAALITGFVGVIYWIAKGMLG